MADPIRRNERHRAYEFRRRDDVCNLARRDLSLPRLALALPESADVENESSEATLREGASVDRRHLLLHREPRSRDDHRRLALAQPIVIADETTDEGHTVA